MQLRLDRQGVAPNSTDRVLHLRVRCLLSLNDQMQHDIAEKFTYIVQLAGIHVMLDVVTNHVGYGDYSYFHPSNQPEHFHNCTGDVHCKQTACSLSLPPSLSPSLPPSRSPSLPLSPSLAVGTVGAVGLDIGAGLS